MWQVAIPEPMAPILGFMTNDTPIFVIQQRSNSFQIRVVAEAPGEVAGPGEVWMAGKRFKQDRRAASRHSDEEDGGLQ